MGRVEYREAEATSVLNPVRGMGFRWSANAYRGCTHGCHYCFARRYHPYLGLGAGDDFASVIVVKVNAPAVLARELSRPAWRRETVTMGTATDPYQPIEGRYRLTRGMLEALVGSRTPTSIVTKGPLVVRDVDVLADLQARAGAVVAVSVATLEVERWRQLEPGTAPPRQRLRAVERVARAGVPVGVLLAPVIPGLTTDQRGLEAVVRAAADHGASFLGGGLLHLEPDVKAHFEEFLKVTAPDLVPLYRRLYRGAYAPPGVEASVSRTLQALRARLGLSGRWLDPAHGRQADPDPEPPLAGSQLSLGLEGGAAGPRCSRTSSGESAIRRRASSAAPMAPRATAT
jgi:DNA repair photolyase